MRRIQLVLAATLAAACCAALAGENDKPTAPFSDQQLIDSAMKAAPAKVAGGAKIIAFDDKGAMRVLREGSNGFTCMADNPTTPGPDPMCMDAAAMAWANALMASSRRPPARSA